MMYLSRRILLQSLLASSAIPALAQQNPPQDATPAPNPFRFEEVVRRARDLAGVPFDPAFPSCPSP